MKTVDFSETIEACDLKVGKCRQLIDFMKVTRQGKVREIEIYSRSGNLLNCQ